MKNKIILYLIFLFCVHILFANNSTQIKVGIYNNPPKIYLNKKGIPVGFWADITNYIAKKENWKIEWKFDSWNNCLKNLLTNKIDMMIDVGVTPQREKLLLFNKQTVLLSWVRLYRKKGSKIHSILDLKDKKIGALKGSFDLNGPQGLRNTLKNFNITAQIVEMKSYEDIFKALENKEIDAGITDADYGNLNASKYRIEKTFIILQPAQMKFAFPKNSKFSRYLINRIDYHLKKLKEDKNSIYYTSLEKNLIGTKEIKIFPLHFKFLLILIASLSVILFLFNLILKHEINKKTLLLKKDLYKIINFYFMAI